MAAQVAAIAPSQHGSLKRNRDFNHGSQWQLGHARAQSINWDHYQDRPDFQSTKKLKSDALIPANFGANIGWTAGPSMMDLLSQKQPLQRPETAHGNLSIGQDQNAQTSLSRLQSHDQYEQLQHQQHQKHSHPPIRGHRRHQSVPAAPTYTTQHHHLPQVAEHPQICQGILHDLEDMAYFYGEFEHIDDRLSLGEIVWIAPKAAVAALPSTFEIAEGLANFPPPAPLSNTKQTISKYVSHEESNRRKACKSIRESSEWLNIQDDPIFRDLSHILRSAGSRRPSIIERLKPKKALEPLIEEMEVDKKEAMMQVQDSLIDALNACSGEERKRDSGIDFEPNNAQTAVSEHGLGAANASPAPKIGHRRAQSFTPQVRDFMKTHGHSASLQLQPAFDFRPIANLKPALKPAHKRGRSQSPERNVTFSSVKHADDNTVQPLSNFKKGHRHSRSASPQRQDLPVVPEPRTFAVDNAQEDILAKLGVTGTAQKVYATPGPALNPNSASPSRSQSPEQRAFRFPPPSSSTTGRLASPVHVLQPLREVSHNSAAGPGGKKRGRSQSEHFDDSMKRQKDIGVMHSAGGLGMGRQRW